jgi:cyclopropane fatty-acyl-phospholipid synthase-like methyltransferase
MSSAKVFSEACERNRGPILAVLRDTLAASHRVLEVGSGSGQHAAYFAPALPHLQWQATDVAGNLESINEWLAGAPLANALPPLALDINGVWPQQRYDAVFSANTLHIVSWTEVGRMLAGMAGVLERDGLIIIYGPFKYGGHHTSESNARFDGWLKGRDPASGIRDFENVDALARSYGFGLQHDFVMPAHNRTLVWRRLSVSLS